MNFCSNCGAKNSTNSKFCPDCGHTLTVSASKNDSHLGDTASQSTQQPPLRDLLLWGKKKGQSSERIALFWAIKIAIAAIFVIIALRYQS